MLLHHHVLFSLAIAVIAEGIFMWTSDQQVPSLHRVALRYLKLVTFSNFWLFMHGSASAWDQDLMLFMLLVMILFFSVLTSIQHAIALSTSLLVSS